MQPSVCWANAVTDCATLRRYGLLYHGSQRDLYAWAWWTIRKKTAGWSSSGIHNNIYSIVLTGGWHQFEHKSLKKNIAYGISNWQFDSYSVNLQTKLIKLYNNINLNIIFFCNHHIYSEKKEKNVLNSQERFDKLIYGNKSTLIISDLYF